MRIDVKILDSRLNCPEYFPKSSPDNAGTDLRACIDEYIALDPGKSQMISAGVAVAIPEGFFGMIVPRSGLGSKGIHLKNVAGIIDASYRGPLMMNVVNNGDERIYIEPLDRIMQLLILPVQYVEWKEVESLDNTSRNSNGFGSSGTN